MGWAHPRGRETGLDHGPDVALHGGVDRGSAGEHVGRAGEGDRAGGGLVEQHPERPDVRVAMQSRRWRGGAHQTDGQFRRAVPEGAAPGGGLGPADGHGPRCDQRCRTQVGDLPAVAEGQHVGRFQIAMDDPGGVDAVDPPGHVGRYRCQLGPPQRPRAQEVVAQAVLGQLLDQDHTAAAVGNRRLEHVEDLDDVRVAGQLPGRLVLLPQLLAIGWRQMHDGLEGGHGRKVGRTEAGVPGPVHRGEATVGDVPHHRPVLEGVAVVYAAPLRPRSSPTHEANTTACPSGRARGRRGCSTTFSCGSRDRPGPPGARRLP